MIRIGHGYDVHRLVPERKLIIGGADIPYHLGLLGHSDADVLLHAVTDAIFGACAMGDIGQHFPDSDDRWKGISSMELLKIAVEKIHQNGFRVHNIDSTIICQAPKLAPCIADMRKNIADCCGIDISYVNVKATTEEKLGFTGAGDGIAAHAVCTVLPL